MFHALGHVVSRHWLLVVAGWILAVVGLSAIAPRWDDVARGGQFTFLPPTAPSRQGQDLLDRAFPDDLLSSSIVIVAHRPQGAPATAADATFIQKTLKPALIAIADAAGGLAEPDPETEDEEPVPDRRAPAAEAAPRSIIARIRTPQDKVIGPLLQSEDQRASLVILDLTTDFLEHRNHPVVAEVELLLTRLQIDHQVPAGLELTLTGSATLGRDMTRAEGESAAATKFWTIVLVIGLLVLIYRAPLLAVLPLITLYVGVEISVKVLAILAGYNVISVFEGLQVYITVVAYGAGVDYTLFLTARYKEHLDEGAGYTESIADAIEKVGAAVTASAATVILGIGMMSFAEFGKLHEAGIGMAISLFIVLCATISFSPALLRMAGRWAFWPMGEKGKLPLNHPWLTGFTRWEETAVHRFWETSGRWLERRPGLIWLATMAVMMPGVVFAVMHYDKLSFGLIEELPRHAPSVVGARVLREHFPEGISGPVTVVLKNSDVDFSDTSGRDLVQHAVDALEQHRDRLHIADIRSVVTPVGITAASQRGFSNGGTAVRLIERARTLQHAREYYVSTADGFSGGVTRLDVVLTQDPFSRESVRNLDAIRQTIVSALPTGVEAKTELAFTGSTASVRDVQVVAEGDRWRINTLVTLVVFGILVLLLRTFAISLYLILSVLFSYLATLGATYALFMWLYGPEFVGLDWTVPLFLFTLLIAVGEDYNIFLMTRIHEEQENYGPVHGITVALTRTGGIITSCGFIMAGTFASLSAGSLARMDQLGFALAFGVLLDTFVVRPVLVPAFLMLLNNGQLGAVGRYFAAHRSHAIWEAKSDKPPVEEPVSQD